MKRFKVEYVSCPNLAPYWFDTKKEMEEWVAWMKSVPINDGPIQFRITEYRQTSVKVV